MMPQAVSNLQEGQNDLLSLGQAFQDRCRQFAPRIAHNVPIDKERRDFTYTDLYERVFRYAGALWDLGLRRGDKVCLFSENCYEWGLVDWACQTLGLVLVPVYPTLPAEQAQFIAEDCGAKIFICGSETHQGRVEKAITIRKIQLKDGHDSIDHLSQSPSLSREAWEAEIAAGKPDELATIIYTSGTTGNPKGAMLDGRAFVWLSRAVRTSLPIDENDVFLGWLPMAHVYERFAGHILPTLCGAKICYARSLATLADDMATCKPTIMLIVPRFLESMRDRILDGVKKAPPMRQKLFHAMLSAGTAKLHGKSPLLHGLLDKLVGTKIRERTGGRLKFFVSGGSALPMHIYEFFGAFGLPVMQGYGLTETCAASSFNEPGRNKPETVGIPVQGIQFKIEADGEICIKAPSVMRGYFNQPEATAAAIDDDGWFHTGDIGVWVGEHVKITDRKKDILVLANGKNVAPQPIENKLRESEWISEAVLLGDNQTYVGALIVPDFDRLSKYCKEHGIKLENPEDAIDHEPIKQLIKADIDKTNKTLADFEKVKRFELIHARFSIETGELTPSLKVKRKVVKAKFEDAIKRLFKES